jgi:transcriptional regulator with GAF, ATPase, and Fis domain
VQLFRSALVDTLLESQLFGHVRGSFTGATETHPGLFEYANDGTVFLDEVGETSLQMQAKLLRVIQNREIQRVGSPEVKKMNVRMIAATNRDLRVEVFSGGFREDLFYRLSSIEIRVPGLTERPEDIPILMQHFLKEYSQAYEKPLQGLTRRAQIALLQHDWPGNVRELENVISSAAIKANAGFSLMSRIFRSFFRSRAGPAHRRRSYGGLSRSTRCAASIFNACLKCATETACVPRKCWESVVQVSTASSSVQRRALRLPPATSPNTLALFHSRTLFHPAACLLVDCTRNLCVLFMPLAARLVFWMHASARESEWRAQVQTSGHSGQANSGSGGVSLVLR